MIVDDEQEKYREQYWNLLPIFSKHFPKLSDRQKSDICHHYIAAESVALTESWNYQQQQDNLTRLRFHLRSAAENLSTMPGAILSELKTHLGMPLEILNGTYDRKTCDQAVFDMEPSHEDYLAAEGVLTGLVAFSENLDKAIKYTQEELPEGIPVGNRNIRAWRVVEGAVEASRNFPEDMNIPKRMNGSGPLRHLLLDLFEYHNIHSNVDAAYNGWLKNIDRKRESLDLLPID